MCQQKERESGSLFRRVSWFILLWIAGVSTVAIVAYGLKAWISG